LKNSIYEIVSADAPHKFIGHPDHPSILLRVCVTSYQEGCRATDMRGYRPEKQGESLFLIQP